MIVTINSQTLCNFSLCYGCLGRLSAYCVGFAVSWFTLTALIMLFQAGAGSHFFTYGALKQAGSTRRESCIDVFCTVRSVTDLEITACDSKLKMSSFFAN